VSRPRPPSGVPREKEQEGGEWGEQEKKGGGEGKKKKRGSWCPRAGGVAGELRCAVSGSEQTTVRG